MKVEDKRRAYKGEDAFLWLPTSFGKSVCYEVLSFVCLTVLNEASWVQGGIARNATTRTSHSLETSVTFPLHVLHVLLREPTAVQTLTLVTSLPCP